MSSKDTKVLEFNQNQKSDKAPFIIYADLDRLIEKIDGCKNNLEKLIHNKIRQTYSIRFFNFYISSFKIIENKHDVYRGKDCIKKFCESLREQAIKISNFKKKKIKLLTKEEQESYKNAKIYYI